MKRTRLSNTDLCASVAVILMFLQKSIAAFSSNVHIIPPSGDALHPPMILIGGMAQTKASWEHQIPYLNKNRQVIVYECMGQGKRDKEDDSNDDVSLKAQAEQLLATLQERDDIQTPVDLVGFSFGARVALATMVLLSGKDVSSCIRKLHLTGVATDRSDYGHLAVQAWKECLQQDPSMRSFAWSILMATYSSYFLRQQQQKSILDRYVDHICNNNSRNGLVALMEQAEVSDTSDPWHVANMAQQIMSQQFHGKGRICVGKLDQMAPPEYATELSERLGWGTPFVIPGCAHAVAVEGARSWRKDVLDFLNDDS